MTQKPNTRRLKIENDAGRGMCEGAYAHQRDILVATVEHLDQFFWSNWEAIQILRAEDQPAAWAELLRMLTPEPEPMEPVGAELMAADCVGRA